MIDQLRLRERKIRNVRDFRLGELYLQHCQQSPDKEDSPEDIIRLFKIHPEQAVYGIGKPDDGIRETNAGTLTLHNLEIYTTNLDPKRFDKGRDSVLDQFRIDFRDYMGYFYHIPHGFEDVETLFGIDLKGHTGGEYAIFENHQIEQEEPDKYKGVLIG